MSKDEEAGLRTSYDIFGDLQPIVIDQNNFIVHGNHRTKVLQELGASEITAIQRYFEDANERRLCSQTLNKLHGEYEKELDSNQLLKLLEGNKLEQLSALTAKPLEEFQNLITRFHPEIKFQNEDDFDLEKELEELVPETQLGDIWELDNRHRIICADNTDKRSLTKLIADKKIQLVFADPPYNIKGEHDQTYYGAYQDNTPEKEYAEFCKTWFSTISEISDRIIITPGTFCIKFYPQYLDMAIWFKANSSTYAQIFNTRTCEPILFFGDGFKKDGHKERINDFFEYSKEMSSIKEGQKIRKEMNLKNFAPEKPIRLLADIIQSFSKQADIITDPFLGSGTTLLACEQTRRICYGIELDPHYVDVAIKRWERFTSKKAKKLS